MPPTHTLLSETDTLVPAEAATDVFVQPPEEALDRETIADLSSTQISRMSCGELARVVRAARLPASSVRPEKLDRGTLERLAHLACLSCRHRT